jgi:hypothetical protein
MPEFYVQCGPIQTIIVADSAEQAALSAIDHALQSHLWIYEDPELNEHERHDHLMVEALLHLEPNIRLNERGFDCDDAQLIGTPETIERWHQMNVRINNMLIAAGLPPRRPGGDTAWPSEAADARQRHPR